MGARLVTTTRLECARPATPIFASSFSTAGAQTRDTDPDATDRAGNVGLSLRNASYGASYSYTSVGKNYRAALGFVRRRDILQHGGSTIYSPIFEKGPFRQIRFRSSGSYISGQDGEKQSRQVSPNISFQLLRRDQFSVNGSRQFERSTQSFLIRPDAEISTGDYTYSRFALRGIMDAGRRFFSSTSINRGAFFHGTRWHVTGSVGFRPSKNLTIEGRTSYSKMDLPIDNGAFSATTASLDILASVIRKSFAKALIQYDNFSRDLRANVRIEWIHTRGSHLFLVFNTSYHLTESHEDLFDPNRECRVVARN